MLLVDYLQRYCTDPGSESRVATNNRYSDDNELLFFYYKAILPAKTPHGILFCNRPSDSWTRLLLRRITPPFSMNMGHPAIAEQPMFISFISKAVLLI